MLLPLIPVLYITLQDIAAFVCAFRPTQVLLVLKGSCLKQHTSSISLLTDLTLQWTQYDFNNFNSPNHREQYHSYEAIVKYVWEWGKDFFPFDSHIEKELLTKTCRTWGLTITYFREASGSAVPTENILHLNLSSPLRDADNTYNTYSKDPVWYTKSWPPGQQGLKQRTCMFKC